jgi:hypothetical protein
MTYTAIGPKSMQRLFNGNPFMSQWLSIANTMAGTVRGFWAAEFARMQAAGIQAFNREAMRVWTTAWTMPTANGATAPMAAATEIVAAAGEATERAIRRPMRARQAAITPSAKPRARPAATKPVSRKPVSGKRAPSRR